MEASPLGLVAAHLRAHLPPGVDAGYLDGFLSRHRDALVAQLRPVSARVLLVGCGERKAAEAAPARELYTGSLTRAAMRHADRTGHPWFVVSALWGLVEPGEVVEPYNVRVTELDARAQALLGEQVARRLRSAVPVARVAEVHAGEAYLRVVRGPLQAQGFVVEAPLAGLEIGERLRWYREVSAGR